MAYGRLDVFWPDGQFKTYLLSDSSISIGRSAGNAIPLETDTLSRYHNTITHVDGETCLTDLDSANGTFVDGVRLKSNTPHTLYDGEEISIGELRLIFHNLDETPTRPITVPEEVTRRIELEEAPFYIEIEGPQQAIPPGAHISARLSITNTGTEPERYRVEVSGVPKDWARIDRPDLEIAAGQSADVIVNFKPRRRSDSAPGEYLVQLAVHRRSKPEPRLRGTVHLQVLPFGGFGMALERGRYTPGDRFRLHVHNQGSAPLPLNLITRDLTDSLSFAIPTAHLVLAPGQRAVLQGTVKPRATHFFGEAREHSFDLIARSGDAAAFTIATRAYLDEKPPLPSWAAFALGGLAVAVLIIIAIGLALLLQPAPPNPVITSFSVNATRLAQGETLVVNWAVSDATDLTLTVDGAPVAIDPNMQSAPINTAPLHGQLEVLLVAANGTRQTQESAMVEVFKPITVSYFRIEPPRIVLYTVQTITVSWSAPGSNKTVISGFGDFSPLPDPEYGNTGSYSAVGIPRGALTFTLMAQNEDTTSQQTLQVETIAPQCTAENGDVSLRASPDNADQVVATIPDGTTIIVDAQDALGQWLRVELTGGAHGWGERTAFTCADNFSVDDLYKELIVATARPDFTIVPTLTTAIPATGSPGAAPTLAPTNRPPATPNRTPSAAPQTTQPNTLGGQVAPVAQPTFTPVPTTGAG
jgi:pSer/pThr/pTyr-binding forkhead associated (FHA) protein